MRQSDREIAEECSPERRRELEKLLLENDKKIVDIAKRIARQWSLPREDVEQEFRLIVWRNALRRYDDARGNFEAFIVATLRPNEYLRGLLGIAGQTASLANSGTRKQAGKLMVRFVPLPDDFGGRA
jgi:hypothetical protein